METFNLSTSQNVALEYTIASIGDRILANIIDWLLLGFYITMLAIIFSSNLAEMGLWVLIFLLPVFFYHLIFEIFFNGQSPGKMVMHIKVVKADGSQLSVGACFIRWIFRFVDITLFMGAIAVLILIVNGKGQRLGDIAASTTVLRTHKKATLERTSWMHVEKNYEPKYFQTELLSDQDIQTVKEVLEVVFKQPDTANSKRLLKQTREAIVARTSIHSDLPDKVFLNTIVKDYNAIHRSSVQV